MNESLIIVGGVALERPLDFYRTPRRAEWLMLNRLSQVHVKTAGTVINPAALVRPVMNASPRQ